MTLPDPARLATYDLEVGERLYRAHPHPFGSTEFDVRRTADARFSTVCHDGHVVPVIYAGDSDTAATVETILRLSVSGRRPDRVFAARYATWQWSTIVPTRTVTVADLRDTAWLHHGLPRDGLLDGGPDTYRATRGWLEQVLAVRPDIEGLAWHSRQSAALPEPTVSYLLIGSTTARAAVDRDDLDGVGPTVPFISSVGATRLRAVGTALDVTVVID